MADRLLSGYYPGTPFTRKPTRGAYNRSEYKGTPVDDFFEHMMAAPPLSVPRWLWQQEVKQIENSYMARGGYTQQGSDYIASLDDDEMADLPGGAGVAVNLNPVDWISDPGKQVKKHLQDHLRSIANKDDFVQRTKMEMWKKHYLKDSRSPYSLSDSYSADMSARAQRDLAVAGGVPTYDVYDDVRSNVPSYFQQSKSQFFRNEQYAEASNSIMTGLGKELTDKRSQFTSAEHVEAVDNFNEKVAVATSVSNIASSMGEVQKQLNKSALRGERRKERINNKVNILWENTKDARAAIDAVKAQGRKQSAEVGELDRHVARLEKKLIKTTKVGKDKYGNAIRVTQSLPLKKSSLYTGVGVRSPKLFNNNARGGAGGSYIQGVLKKEVRNKKSALNKAIHSGEANISGAGKNMGAISAAISADRDWNTAFDLVDAAEKGNLLNQYVFQTIIRPRIEKWTPSYYISKAVKGNILEKERFKNKLKVQVGVTSISVRGGDHFGMSAKALKTMTKVDKTTGEAKSLIPLLEGKFMASHGLTNDDVDALKAGKAWLKKNKLKFRLAYGTSGELLDNAQNREILGKIYGKALIHRQNPSAFSDPSKEKTSLLNKYTGFLSRVQASTYGKAYRAIFKTGDVFRQKVTQKLMMLVERAIENLIGAATGGIGKLVAMAIRVVAAKVLSKAIAIMADMFKNLRGFNFDDMYDLMLEAIKVAVGCLLGCIACCSFLVFSIVMLVMGFISALKGEDFTPLGGNIIGGGSHVEIETMSEFDVSDSDDLDPSRITDVDQ